MEALLVFIFQLQIVLKTVDPQFKTIRLAQLNPLPIMYHPPVNLLQLLFDKYTINQRLNAELCLLLKAELFRLEIVDVFVVFKCHLTRKQRDINSVKVINL